MTVSKVKNKGKRTTWKIGKLFFQRYLDQWFVVFYGNSGIRKANCLSLTRQKITSSEGKNDEN